MRSPLPSAALCVAALCGPAVSGARAEGLAGAAAGKPYTVTVAKVAAQKGKPATTQVIIRPAKGWHLNLDFPTSLKLSPPQGVSATKAALGKKDAKITEQEGSFEVTLTSLESGRKAVPGDLKFAVCTDTTCDPQRSPITIEMDVK